MFEDRTTENLKKEVLEAIRPEAGVSTLAGSYADAVAGPLCQMVSNLYKALPAVTSMLFIDESSGRFIDLVAQDYHDLTRRAGTRARCTVTLTGKAGTAIPAGTVFLTGTGLQFLLLESVAIGSGGSAVGRLEAAEAGSAYNIASGTLSRMYVNINGLERYVNGQAEGGTDRESDAALYQRVDEARKQPATSGNGWDYRRWAMEADGVGEVKVVELWDGPGTVGLTLVDSNFEGASQEIVEAVAANIQVKRPPGRGRHCLSGQGGGDPNLRLGGPLWRLCRDGPDGAGEPPARIPPAVDPDQVSDHLLWTGTRSALHAAL